MALSNDRNTPRREDELDSIPVKAATKLYGGALVCADASGWAVPASSTAGLVARGRADEQVDNTAGANGDLSIRVRRGVFRWDNSAAGDAITQAEIGKHCFVIDDHTVAKTPGNGNRPVAGKVFDVDAQGAWVQTGDPSYDTRKVYLPFFINQTDTLAGTAAELVSPVVGAITSMSVTVQIAPTTGGPVTAAVGVTAVAGLSCVIADGAAKGTVVTDTPTAGDATTAVAVGSRIQVVPDAAFATAGAISGFVEITF